MDYVNKNVNRKCKLESCKLINCFKEIRRLVVDFRIGIGNV